MRVSSLGLVVVFVTGLANAAAATPPGNFSLGSYEAKPAYATLTSWFNEGAGETSAQVEEPSLLEDPYAKDSADCGAGSCGKGGGGKGGGGCLWGGLCNCCGYDPCCRRWIVNAGALFLTRDINADRVFVTCEQDEPQIAADDYGSLGTQVGPYADVIWQGDCWGLEARYFEVDGWTATAGADSIGFPTGAQYEFLTPVTYFVGPTDVTSTYTSELHSFELNLRRRFTCTCSGFIGFRTVELDERLNFDGLVDHTYSTNASVATQNRLYGLQIGLDGTLCRINRFSLEGWGRAGIYANNREARSAFDSYTPDPVDSIHISRSLGDCEAAFVGDLGLFAVYQITPCLAIRAGYTALWLDGVSTAAGQMPNITPCPICPTGGQMSDDTVFAHGAMVGLEYYWCAAGGGGKGWGLGK